MDPLWQTVALSLFWGGLLLLAYTFAGYAALMGLLAKWFPKPAGAACIAGGVPGEVSVVLVAYNEGARLEARIRNVFESDYPADRLEMVVVSDGSTDDSVEILERLAAETGRVRVVALEKRGGKSAGLNAGVAAARGEIVVFADARQAFDSAAIGRLASHFADAKAGAVSGSLEIEKSSDAVAHGVGSYWELEKRLRRAEARFDSSIGATGAIYAIRKTLFEPLPPGTILDDVVIPMTIALQGYRVIFDAEAVAHDPQELSPEAERARKPRTLGGNFQMFFRYPCWLLPWRNRLWWQLISHKYLRLLAPAMLVAVLAGNVMLFREPFYRACLGGQAMCYALAAAGALLKKKGKLLSIPAGFVFLNVMVVRGFFYFLRSRERVGWK